MLEQTPPQMTETKTCLTPDLKEKLMIPNLRALESHVEYDSDQQQRPTYSKLEKHSNVFDAVHSEQYLTINPNIVQQQPNHLSSQQSQLSEIFEQQAKDFKLPRNKSGVTHEERRPPSSVEHSLQPIAYRSHSQVSVQESELHESLLSQTSQSGIHSSDKEGLAQKKLESRRGFWDPREDQKLRHAVETWGTSNWLKVSEMMEDRAPDQCQYRWQKMADPVLVKGHWTEEEDEKLRQAVRVNQAKNWRAISEYVGGRTEQQCHKRWNIVLNPDIVKGHWTREQDNQLIMAELKYGAGNWCKIAKHVQGRSNHQCLHRWRHLLKSDLVRDIKSSWTIKEDTKLTYLVKEKGPKRWKQIAAQIPGKKPKQCRERWHNHLNPNIKNNNWSLQEEMVLFIVNREHGNKWKELTQILECRSNNNIKNHWNSIMKSKYQVIFDEIDRQFRQTCVKSDIEYIGSPIVDNFQCSSAYKVFYQNFEQELLQQLTDQIKMQNMVYFQLKGNSKAEEMSQDQLDEEQFEASEATERYESIPSQSERQSLSQLNSQPSKRQKIDESVVTEKDQKPWEIVLTQNTDVTTTAVSHERCLSPLANPQDQTQNNKQLQGQRHLITNINFGKGENDDSKACVLNFQIQVPPHEDTKVLNICLYRDSKSQNPLQTYDKNLNVILSNPKYGIKVSVSKLNDEEVRPLNQD